MVSLKSSMVSRLSRALRTLTKPHVSSTCQIALSTQPSTSVVAVQTHLNTFDAFLNSSSLVDPAPLKPVSDPSIRSQIQTGALHLLAKDYEMIVAELQKEEAYVPSNAQEPLIRRSPMDVRLLLGLEI